MADGEGQALTCGVEGCSGAAVGYLNRQPWSSRVEIFVGTPTRPRHLPLCARHLSAPPATASRAPADNR